MPIRRIGEVTIQPAPAAPTAAWYWLASAAAKAGAKATAKAGAKAAAKAAANAAVAHMLC